MRFLTFVNSAFSFKSFVFDNAFLADNNQTIVLAVCPRKNSNPVCSGCSCKGPIYDHSSCRLFEHVPLWDRRVFLQYAMRRVDCKRCGIKVELVPWAKGKQRMTNDFRHFLSTWARRLTWSEVAAYFRTNWNTVYRAVQDTVEWGLKNRDLSSIEAIGVDEIHIRKGQNYMTLVYQIDKGARRLLAIRPGRKAKTLMRCFRDIGPAAYGNIRFVCSDMWKAYLKVINKRLPQAIHVLDKFHIVAHLHKAVDEVRREEASRMAKEGYEPILKKAKYCLLKRPENLTPNQELKLNDLLHYDLRSMRAYQLKESFRAIWEYDSVRWARWYWQKWSARAMRSKLEPIKKFVRTIRNHEDLIFNYWKARKEYNSGVVEGLNRKVNVVTRKAYGFRSEEVYRTALFHTLGRLPEPPVTHRFC
jgi:transposase